MSQQSRAGAAVFVALLPLLGAVAIPSADAQTRRARPLENVKVMKGWDGDAVRAEMRVMADALGVKCDHCHVQGNFASDEKRSKATARRMIEMTIGLNADYFAAAAPPAPAVPAAAGAETSKFGRVTCYTCHQGAAVPKTSGGYGDHE